MVRNPFKREEVKKEEEIAAVATSDKVAPVRQVIEQEINLSLLNYKLNILLEKVEEINGFLQGGSANESDKTSS